MAKVATETRRGNRLKMLKALALLLAKQLDAPGIDPKVLASIARQYRETIREIEEIEGVKDDDDDIGAILQRREADGEPGAVRKNRA